MSWVLRARTGLLQRIFREWRDGKPTGPSWGRYLAGRGVAQYAGSRNILTVPAGKIISAAGGAKAMTTSGVIPVGVARVYRKMGVGGMVVTKCAGLIACWAGACRNHVRGTGAE